MPTRRSDDFGSGRVRSLLLNLIGRRRLYLQNLLRTARYLTPLPPTGEGLLTWPRVQDVLQEMHP